MLETLNTWIGYYNTFVGGYAVMLLLVPLGIYFTFRLGFIQVAKIGHAFDIVRGKFEKDDDKGDISPFRALTTALSATVGTGNIVGVSLAIYVGGPGAIFWMWLTGFFGMATKFAKSTLAHFYRQPQDDGSYAGGPMYYIEHGLKEKLGGLARSFGLLFAIGTVLCSFGTGNMAQSNSMSDALGSHYGVPNLLSGIVIAALVFMVIIGGIKRIATVTSKLVPIMAVFYGVAATVVILLNIGKVPQALMLIVSDAFTGTSATGGFLGSTFIVAARYGIARGLFSNEAGQGSAAIAHAAAKINSPVRQGLVASLGPLVDTLIICTMTALVIILTGTWESGLKGVSMTIEGFSSGLAPIGLGGLGTHVVAIGLFLFALSTTLSWSYYGDRASLYLFGSKAVKPYRVVYCIFVFLGAVWGIDLVWNFSDMVITFMTIPNLIAIVLLFPKLREITTEYFNKQDADKATA